METLPSTDPATPYWSVMITAFNRDLLRHAIRSVLAQDQGPACMHIEVVDDHSTQCDIKAIVLEEGKGRVEYHRNEANVGLYENWNVCLRRARGQWVHILHDDDIVLPGFYQAMESGATLEPSIGAAFCQVQVINEQGLYLGSLPSERPSVGVFPNFLWRLGRNNAIRFPAMVVRRAVYQQVGYFDPQADFIADWDMWMRIAAKFPVWHDPRLLAGYRQHESSETSNLARTARDVRGIIAGFDKWLVHQAYSARALAMMSIWKERYAAKPLSEAGRYFSSGDFVAGWRRTRAALDCSKAPSVLRKVPETLKNWDEFRAKIGRAASSYQSSRASDARSVLLEARARLARQWLEFDPSELPTAYLPELRGLHWTIVQSNLNIEPRVASDEQILQQSLRALEESPASLGHLLVAMLFSPAENLPESITVDHVPDWLLGDYLFYATYRPGFTIAPPDQVRHAALLVRLEGQIRQKIAAGVDLDMWRKAADIIAKRNPANPIKT